MTTAVRPCPECGKKDAHTARCRSTRRTWTDSETRLHLGFQSCGIVNGDGAIAGSGHQVYETLAQLPQLLSQLRHPRLV
jgi:hypothetical protein